MLTEEERKKIEEEEKLRAELREKHDKPKKKKTSVFTWIMAALLVGSVFIIAFSGGSSTSSETDQPKARNLDAEISSDKQGINVYNKEQEVWTNCKVRLNVYWKTQRIFKPGQSVILYDDLLKDGSQRFNWYSTKPTDINIQCDNPYGIIQGIF